MSGASTPSSPRTAVIMQAITRQMEGLRHEFHERIDGIERDRRSRHHSQEGEKSYEEEHNDRRERMRHDWRDREYGRRDWKYERRDESKNEREVDRGYLKGSEKKYKRRKGHFEINERHEGVKTKECTTTYCSSYLRSRDIECHKCLGRGHFTFQCPNWETKLKRENRDIISKPSSLSSIFKSEKKREKSKESKENEGIQKLERKELSEKKEIEGKELHHNPLFECDDFLLREFKDFHVNSLFDCAKFDCDDGDKEKNATEIPKVSYEEACSIEEPPTKETPKGLNNCRKLQRYIPTIPKLGPLLIDLHKTCILYKGKEEYFDELHPLECHLRFDLKEKEMHCNPLPIFDKSFSNEFSKVLSNPVCDCEVSLLKGCDKEKNSKKESMTSNNECSLSSNAKSLISDLEYAYFDSNTIVKFDCNNYTCGGSKLGSCEIVSTKDACGLEGPLAKVIHRGLNRDRKPQRYIPTSPKLEPLLIDLHESCIHYKTSEDQVGELHSLEYPSRIDLKVVMHEYDHTCGNLIESKSLCSKGARGMLHDTHDLVDQLNLHIPCFRDIQVDSHLDCFEWKLEVKSDKLHDKFENASSLKLFKLLPPFGMKCMNEHVVDSSVNSKPLGFYRVMFEPGIDEFASIHLFRVLNFFGLQCFADHLAYGTVLFVYKLYSINCIAIFEDRIKLAFFRVVFEPGGSLETFMSFLGKHGIWIHCNKLDFNLFCFAGVNSEPLGFHRVVFEPGDWVGVHIWTNELILKGESILQGGYELDITLVGANLSLFNVGNEGTNSRSNSLQEGEDDVNQESNHEDKHEDHLSKEHEEHLSKSSKHKDPLINFGGPMTWAKARRIKEALEEEMINMRSLEVNSKKGEPRIVQLLQVEEISEPPAGCQHFPELDLCNATNLSPF